MLLLLLVVCVCTGMLLPSSQGLMLVCPRFSCCSCSLMGGWPQSMPSADTRPYCQGQQVCGGGWQVLKLTSGGWEGGSVGVCVKGCLSTHFLGAAAAAVVQAAMWATPSLLLGMREVAAGQQQQQEGVQMLPTPATTATADHTAQQQQQ